MTDQGLDITSDADLVTHSLQVERTFMRRMTSAIHDIRPGLPIHYNGRSRLSADPQAGLHGEIDQVSHFEIESLPSSIWGYDHFPLYVRYIQTLGKPYFGMTGRCHKGWGDVGGLKPKAALEFECFQMLAAGAACSVGDQLDPAGKLDRAVYDRIGDVFHQVAAVEPWCDGGEPTADIGVLLSSKREGPMFGSYRVEVGAMRMLLELHHQFQFIDHSDDLSRYRLVVVPDEVEVDATLRARLDEYLKSGGSLLVTGTSGLSADTPRWEALGIEWQGERPSGAEYLLFDDDMPDVAEPMAHVIEARGQRVSVFEGAQILLRIGEPSFQRTATSFTSHLYAPLHRRTDEPAVVRKGNAIYCACPIFGAYRVHGSIVLRNLVQRLIDLLLPDPMLRTDAPTTAHLTVLDQTGEEGSRRLVHVLHYPPVRRTDTLDMIEDVLPLADVSVDVSSTEPERVHLGPSLDDLTFSWADGRTVFTIPRVVGHQLICIVTKGA